MERSAPFTCLGSRAQFKYFPVILLLLFCLLGTAVDLVVSFASPFDNPGAAAGAVSFMQTEAGAARITQTCQELLSVVEDSQSYSCEILDAVDMVILQFPPNAGIIRRT